MRVALDATYSVGSALSGVGVYSRQILFGLARREPESEFLFCYRSHRLLRSLLDRIPSNARRTLLLDDQGPPDCDVFHGLNQRLPAPNSPTPMVCTFHDLFVLTGEYSTPEFRARFADQARLAAERADCIIAVSRFTADQVQTLLGVDRGRVRVVHHGVQPPNPPPGIERESIVLHVGAIQTRKNISRLVEAFETMPKDWRLYFVGSSGFDGENILDQISQSPATSRIVLTGYVSMSQLEELYARASIFAFPSLDEGFGMPILDAMARGVPVITSSVSALPEVAGNAALLVNPLDTGDIAGGLDRLSSDVELRRKLVRNGYERVKQFSWAKAVDQTRQIYRELTGR